MTSLLTPLQLSNLGPRAECLRAPVSSTLVLRHWAEAHYKKVKTQVCVCVCVYLVVFVDRTILENIMTISSFT